MMQSGRQFLSLAVELSKGRSASADATPEDNPLQLEAPELYELGVRETALQAISASNGIGLAQLKKLLRHELQYGLQFKLSSTKFDDQFSPNVEQRSTSNLINLVKNEAMRSTNVRLLYSMLDDRVSQLIGFPSKVKIEIVSIHASFPNSRSTPFRLFETMRLSLCKPDGEPVTEMFGGNLSSFVRDYDFQVILPRLADNSATQQERNEFGRLHGTLFKLMQSSHSSGGVLDRPIAIATSISCTGQSYRQMPDVKLPTVLQAEYECEPPYRKTLTDLYFGCMGLSSRYLLLKGGSAPIAVFGDLQQFNDAQLAVGLGVMESMQKIYRPEVYASTEAIGSHYRPNVMNTAYTKQPLGYDRDERLSVVVSQGKMGQSFVEANKSCLDSIMNDYCADDVLSLDQLYDGNKETHATPSIR